MYVFWHRQTFYYKKEKYLRREKTIKKNHTINIIIIVDMIFMVMAERMTLVACTKTHGKYKAFKKQKSPLLFTLVR